MHLVRRPHCGACAASLNWIHAHAATQIRLIFFMSLAAVVGATCLIIQQIGDVEGLISQQLGDVKVLVARVEEQQISFSKQLEQFGTQLEQETQQLQKLGQQMEQLLRK